MALSIHDTHGATDKTWQLDDMCDMLYMLVSLRDQAFYNNGLDESYKLRYLYEVVPVITDLMERINALEKSLKEQ